MIDFLNIKPIEANINIKDIKNATGLDFGGANMNTIQSYIYRTLENIYKFNNKNLTKKQYNQLYDILTILENINITE